MAGTPKLAAVLWASLAAAAAAAPAADRTAPPVGASGVTPADSAPTSPIPPPEALHAIDVRCASVVSAAVTGARPASSGSDGGRTDDELVRTTHDRAQASGRALGLSADQVDASIEAGAAKILRNLTKTADAAETRQEQLDLGRVLLECAVLQTKP